MLGYIIWIDKDVVKVYYYTDIKEIQEDIIYELLEGCRDISQAKRHNCPFKRFIVSTEGYFSFVSFCNLHQVICVTEVDFWVDA